MGLACRGSSAVDLGGLLVKSYNNEGNSLAKWSVVALAILVFYQCSIAQQPGATPTMHVSTYRYDTPGTILVGTLTERAVYGPPGFGETPAQDIREKIFVLKLAHAISVEPLADAQTQNTANLDPARNIHEVQVFGDHAVKSEISKMVGKKVVIVGILNESVAPSQYTKVWMDVSSVNPDGR
jgi:hypothetical protein